MRFHRPLNRVFQTYWRWSRSLTLGAQGMVLTADNRVLLIRHTYRPGWHFPGGGVEKGEPVALALERELGEEAGVLLDAPPPLHGIFTNFKAFPSDHILLFVVRDWRQPVPPVPDNEIAEHGFFTRDALPEGTIPPVKRRLAEVLDGVELVGTW